MFKGLAGWGFADSDTDFLVEGAIKLASYCLSSTVFNSTPFLEIKTGRVVEPETGLSFPWLMIRPEMKDFSKIVDINDNEVDVISSKCTGYY